MDVTLKASTGVVIDVWRVQELFHARRTDSADEPQTCELLDLFEVLAELAELDLEDGAQAAEAMSLAERAAHRLG